MKQIMCRLFCPMINKFGVCESAMRRVERVRECPHKRMQAAMGTKRAPPEGGAEKRSCCQRAAQARAAIV